MAEGLAGAIAKARAADPDPARQLEELLLGLFENMIDKPTGAQLLMRELMENRTRAELVRQWHLKDFLDAMIAMVRKAPAAKKLTETEALMRIYLVLGALNYLAVSEPTLRQMYPALGDLKKQFAPEIRRLVQRYLG